MGKKLFSSVVVDLANACLHAEIYGDLWPEELGTPVNRYGSLERVIRVSLTDGQVVTGVARMSAFNSAHPKNTSNAKEAPCDDCTDVLDLPDTLNKYVSHWNLTIIASVLPDEYSSAVTFDEDGLLWAGQTCVFTHAEDIVKHDVVGYLFDAYKGNVPQFTVYAGTGITLVHDTKGEYYLYYTEQGWRTIHGKR